MSDFELRCEKQLPYCNVVCSMLIGELLTCLPIQGGSLVRCASTQSLTYQQVSRKVISRLGFGCALIGINVFRIEPVECSRNQGDDPPQRIESGNRRLRRKHLYSKFIKFCHLEDFTEFNFVSLAIICIHACTGCIHLYMYMCIYMAIDHI